MMQEMSKGHLGTRLKMTREDEIGLLANAMDEFSEDLQKNLVATVKKIGEGTLSVDLKSKDNQDEITPAIMATANNLKGLMAEMGTMSKQHDLGDIDVVIASDKFQGAYREMGEGVNKMVLGHIAVKKKAMACVAEFGKGNFDAPLEKFPGKKAFINDTIERLRANLKDFIGQMKHMSDEHNAGDIDVTIPADKFEGAFKTMSRGVNDMVGGHIAVKKKAMACVAEFGKGNFEAPLEKFPGKKVFINNTIEEVRKNLKALIADATMLSFAAVEGKLATRADASKHQGDFRKIVQGVNDTLDAVIGPLNVAAKYVDDISKGNIPAKITDSYNGDFNTIKINLNTCIDAVNALVKDAAMLSAAAVEGKLATRADASKHQGDFRKIVQGVDDCLDAVIGPLNVAAKYVDDISKGNIPAKITDTYNGDFNTIKNNLNTCIDAVNLLVKDANFLAQAGVEGKLATRADASKHSGDFRRIVEGVNMTLDAVVIPINEAADVLDKVAARDMTARVKGDYKGDLGKIKNSINTAVDNLDTALTQVAEATEQVSSGSQQIASGSQSLAQGANEQASSLEEVSSSLEEMSSMTKQNAENANQAKNLAGEADANAKNGAEAMSRMSQSINKIKESSDQTAKIVKTIDEIAMQTNLLALNAAVEAARAGEAGRGFAVVAEEVRNLAQRSAQAAKNTADMISESVKNADDGVKIATEVSKSFEAIAGSAKKVNDLIAEIAAASGEQSQGIDQVNNAVAQMDKVTQQNAANSEESASAAEEMSSQSEELQSMVAQFKISTMADKKVKPVNAGITHAKPTVTHHKTAAAQPEAKIARGGNGKSAKTVATAKADAGASISLNDEVLKKF
jgi:methyl-accepting chemotaxis protein